jgi:hypothetical protein
VDILWRERERERDAGRTRVRWTERIYAPMIAKKDWKNYTVWIVCNGDSGI